MRQFDLLLYFEGRATGGVTGILDSLRRELPAAMAAGIVCSPAPDLQAWRTEAAGGGWTVFPLALANRGGLLGWLEIPHMIALVRLFRHSRIVHFHQHTPFSCLQAIACGRIARTPALIATEHYIAQLKFLRRRSLPTVLRWIREFRIRVQLSLKKLTLPLLRTVVLVSRENLTTFADTFGDPGRPKLTVISNGIPLGEVCRNRTEARAGVRALFGKREVDTIVITVAALNNQKGHSYLLQAIPMVLATCPSTGFLWVGDGHLRQSLEQAGRRAGLCEALVFAGSRRDVRRLLEGSDLFVLPSLFEGMPLSVLEAMAAGCPVVATAVDGTRDVIRHDSTGLLVSPHDPDALAAAIVRLLGKPSERAELARAARRHVEANFSAALMASQYSREYEDLLTRPERRAP